MAKRLTFFFDQEADILYLSLGKPRPARSLEVGDDIVVRIDPKTQHVVGCTILNLTKRFARMKEAEPLPLMGNLTLHT